ncbi:unnamed protein product [Polarella glacialis]|uniref:Uncharacterized protein n=1 Tax=Polarella glacialis TaxID=89957 RepID=A0A813EH97_POLGL|nr:unnamed protein product [Polarella glacialis]
MANVLAGCHSRVVMSYTCSAFDSSHCVNGVAFMRFVPSRILEAVNAAFVNGTDASWWAALSQARFLTEVRPDGPLLAAAKACPPLLVAASLLLAIGISQGLIRAEAQASAFLIRADLLASELREPQAPDWAPLLQRWPGLEFSPAAAWHLAGCRSSDRLRLSTWLAGPLHPEDSACIRGEALISRELIAAAEAASGDDTPPSLASFNAARRQLELRPVPIGLKANYHDFLQLALERHLKEAMASVPDGLLLEFGVAERAGSSQLIARLAKKAWRELGYEKSAVGAEPVLHAFDSFRGLPRDWSIFRAGEFATANGQPPNISGLDDNSLGIQFVVGMFDKTVPAFVQGLLSAQGSGDAPVRKVSLLHLDADLYESTKLVMSQLSPFLAEGSLIIADDIICGPAMIAQQNSGFQANEVWEAISEVLQSGDRSWPWRLEVLAAPWDSHFAHVSLPLRAAFRVRRAS